MFLKGAESISRSTPFGLVYLVLMGLVCFVGSCLVFILFLFLVNRIKASHISVKDYAVGNDWNESDCSTEEPLIYITVKHLLFFPDRMEVTGLEEGKWYAYRVKALNRQGASLPSKPTEEIQAVDTQGTYFLLFSILSGLRL